MKHKHPHLACAEFAKLSFQLQISCDIRNKLPLRKRHSVSSEKFLAEFLTSFCLHSLCRKALSSAAETQGPIKCAIRMPGNHLMGRDRASGQPQAHTDSHTSALPAEEDGCSSQKSPLSCRWT